MYKFLNLVNVFEDFMFSGKVYVGAATLTL